MAACWLLTLLCVLRVTAEGSGSVEVHIEPNDLPVLKYVGDTLSLTCYLSHTSDQPRLKMEWLIPTNAEGRVSLEEEEGHTRVTIQPLMETDGGNYSCALTESHLHKAVKSWVYVHVRPRGEPSHCSHESFRCHVGGHCIPRRYKCDGHPDCPSGSDEDPTLCGPEPCKGKLGCEDGRCLWPAMCCREPHHNPPNCSIQASMQCCRQLIHPADLDQDRYYQEVQTQLSRQQQQRARRPRFSLVMGLLVGMANLVTVGVIVGVRYQMWRLPSPSRAPHCWLRLRGAAALRSLGLAPPPPPSPSPTDLHQLTTDHRLMGREPELYPRRVDLLAPDVVSGQRRPPLPRLCAGGVILCPPTHCPPPPHYSLHDHQAPPPAYHQVVGAPPPPYCPRMDPSSTRDPEQLSPLLLPHQHSPSTPPPSPHTPPPTPCQCSPPVPHTHSPASTPPPAYTHSPATTSSSNK